MSLKTAIERRRLHFLKPAGTSRGVYRTHDVWYVRVWRSEQPERIGVGEVAPLPDLSCDFGADFEARLEEACRALEAFGTLEAVLDAEQSDSERETAPVRGAFEPSVQPVNGFSLKEQPSILFGLETALRQLEVMDGRHPFALWDTPFSRGEQGIPINGLIWMGPYQDMEAQIREKLDKGFRCIKLKIGAIDFEEEFNLLRQIRREYSAQTVTLRVDANGAFSPAEAPEKLKRLAELDLHSIEQPIRAGQWEALAGLIEASPLPIALDEELIGWHRLEDKKRLLDSVQPPFLVLKPTLHGGISGCSEWIRLAEERGIGWWTTSALESNIGLNAVSQWTATLDNPLHQGLGTGMLYADNVPMPLVVEGERLWFRP